MEQFCSRAMPWSLLLLGMGAPQGRQQEVLEPWAHAHGQFCPTRAGLGSAGVLGTAGGSFGVLLLLL